MFDCHYRCHNCGNLHKGKSLYNLGNEISLRYAAAPNCENPLSCGVEVSHSLLQRTAEEFLATRNAKLMREYHGIEDSGIVRDWVKRYGIDWVTEAWLKHRPSSWALA